MTVNTLVEHKKLKALGIGCVSKVLKASVKVNFGTDDCITIKSILLTPVDISGTGTIPFAEWQRQTITNTVKEDTVIVGNEVKHYVGIGWISQGVVTKQDLSKYKRVV